MTIKRLTPGKQKAKTTPTKKSGASRVGRKPRASTNGRPTAIMELCEQMYADAHCELDFGSPFQLLVATILSAQCTDKMVNSVTPALFARYPDAARLAAANPSEIETLIVKTGFFRQKTKSILGAARILLRDHQGAVPRDMEALVKLPGVARKTANVVLGTAYGIPSGFVVDTHVIRLSRRLGLSSASEPVKIEQDLMAKFPQDHWIKLGHQIVWHGRRVCHARKPACSQCLLAPHCPSACHVEGWV